LSLSFLVDFPDPPFVAPSYFKSLTKSLLSTPLLLFDDVPVPDLVASLSVESEIRPGQRLQREYSVPKHTFYPCILNLHLCV